MKRTTEVNRMLQGYNPKPVAKPKRPSRFDASFAAAMGEPEYEFDLATTEGRHCTCEDYPCCGH